MIGELILGLLALIVALGGGLRLIMESIEYREISIIIITALYWTFVVGIAMCICGI